MSLLYVDDIRGKTAATDVDLSNVTNLKMPAGAVIQVVQTVGSTGRQTYSSASFFDIVTVSITPKFSTSKILVSVHTSITRTNSAYANVQITKENSQILSCDTQAAYTADHTVENSVGSVSGQILDSPSTTSATTYKLQARISGSGYLYVDGQPVITAQEIAG